MQEPASSDRQVNSPSFEDNAVLDFFRKSTGHLLSAAAAAGVSHYIALSVVGADRIRDSGYLRAKRVQEGLIEAGGVSYTVLRATQFFEFLNAIADGATTGNVVEYGPGAASPSHRHPSSAFIYATVLEGEIRSQVNDAPRPCLQGRRKLDGGPRRPPQGERQRQHDGACSAAGHIRRRYG